MRAGIKNWIKVMVLDFKGKFEDIVIGVFCCIMEYCSKETKLGSSGQKDTSSAVKNTRVVLVPCSTWKCVPTAVFAVVDFPEVLGYHLLQQIKKFKNGYQKLLQV